MTKNYVNLSNARKEEQTTVMQKIMEDGVCPFCEEHFLTYHPKPIIFKTDNWIVTENAWPYDMTKNHILCVYRTHATHTNEIDTQGWSEIGEIMKRLETKKSLGYGTMLMRFGDTTHTGATVSHLHFHLVQPNTEDPSYIPEEGIRTRIG